ncbi:hypothetical protein NGB36_06805 [Streptomyces sp. RB6PN25]|uniref:Secreted protein n=1 Tax=Streptomyces humicola TaxID=2953240 RepID=A0ABT1PRL8_9ACTN|nr:hypothetical protein [Streptomyces humicola]MCQ4080313.1 hypothetical protein [Streptomyces humicola]
MRKFQQVAVVAAAAVGGLSTIGAGVSFSDAPHVGYNGAASEQGRTAMQPHMAAPQAQLPPPQQGPLLAPQLSPQFAPDLQPQVSPQLAPPREQDNLFHPYQECSPQAVLEANVPVGLLATPETNGEACSQSVSPFIHH